MQVKDIMCSKVECLSPTASLLEASQKMKSCNVGCIPVRENNRVVGMITDRDIVIRAGSCGKDLKSTCVQEVMSPNVQCCYGDDSVEKAAQCMAQHQIRRLPILERGNNQLIGMVCLGDITCCVPSTAETVKCISKQP